MVFTNILAGSTTNISVMGPPNGKIVNEGNLGVWGRNISPSTHIGIFLGSANPGGVAD